MTMLRKLALGTSSFFFFIFIYLTIFSFSFSHFTSYDNVYNIFSTIMQDKEDFEKIGELKVFLTQQCSLANLSEVQIPISEKNISFSCQFVKEASDAEFKDAVLNKLFQLFYYTEYNCEFIDCLKEGNFEVFFSKKANDFFSKWSTFLIIPSIIFALLIIFLSEPKVKAVSIFGWNFLFLGLPILFNKYLRSFIFTKIPQEATPYANMIFDSVFDPISNLMIALLVSGVILVITGFLLERKIR